MALVELTRDGDNEAYTELWQRHEHALRGAIGVFTNQDPDDIAQEAFVRVYEQIRGGRGPATAFRAYLLGAARNIAIDSATRGAAKAEVSGFEESTFEALVPVVPDSGERVLRNEFTRDVFSSLPLRWQEVLWYREVEDLPVKEVAKYLGISPNSTSALIKRAREGFTKAWVAASLVPGRNLPPECSWALNRLHDRSSTMPSAATRKLRRHLNTCKRCAILSEEANHLHKRLALVLFPAVLGLSGAEHYRAWLQRAGEVTSPAMAQALPVKDTTRGRFAHTARVAGLSTPRAIAPLAILSISAIAIALLTSFPVQRELNPTESTQPQRSNSDSGTSEGEREKKEGTRHPSSHLDGDYTTESSEVPIEEAANTTIWAAQEATKPDFQVPSIPNNTGTAVPDSIVPVEDPMLPHPGPSENVSDLLASTLEAAPTDGVEVGVYPNLLGKGEPGATVHLTVYNENGEARAAEVSVSNSGVWTFTPSELRGQLTVVASQTFQRNGVQVEQRPTTIGTFAVGNGLHLRVIADGPNSSIVRATNFGPTETPNQVLNLESPTLGIIVTAHRWTSPRVVEVRLPYSRAALEGIEYWQGDTAQGPRRVWIRHER